LLQGGALPFKGFDLAAQFVTLPLEPAQLFGLCGMGVFQGGQLLLDLCERGPAFSQLTLSPGEFLLQLAGTTQQYQRHGKQGQEKAAPVVPWYTGKLDH
jgi:hypothetical protein